MPNFTFSSVSDGNCLFNTEAIWLTLPFVQQIVQQKKLPEYLQKRRFLQSCGELFRLEIITPKTVTAAFTQLITSNRSGNGEIRWDNIQTRLAAPLRALCVQAIRNHPEVFIIAKAYLEAAIRESQHLHTSSSSEKLQDQDAFAGITAINKHIAAVAQDNSLSTKEEKIQALNRWFFEGDKSGYKLYCSDIAHKGVYTDFLQLKVLSYLFEIPHRWYLHQSIIPHQTYVNGQDSSDGEESPLIFEFQLRQNHWYAVLPNTAEINQLFSAHQPPEENIEEDSVFMHFIGFSLIALAASCYYFFLPMISTTFALAPIFSVINLLGLLVSTLFGFICTFVLLQIAYAESEKPYNTENDNEILSTDKTGNAVVSPPSPNKPLVMQYNNHQAAENSKNSRENSLDFPQDLEKSTLASQAKLSN